jgi:hypothetical protein
VWLNQAEGITRQNHGFFCFKARNHPLEILEPLFFREPLTKYQVEIRVFVNCCLVRDRVVYGVALVQLWCNKTRKHHKVVVLTAELAENC